MRETITEDTLGILTVGLDVGDIYTQVCVLDERGFVFGTERTNKLSEPFDSQTDMSHVP